jgi:hypothetical protein
VLTRLRWDLRRLLEAAILGQFVVRQVLQEAKHQMAGGLTLGGMQVGAGLQDAPSPAGCGRCCAAATQRGTRARPRLHRLSCSEMAAGGGAQREGLQCSRPALTLVAAAALQVGHVAHLGGALAGVLLVWLLSRIPEADSK